jgi:hypothetical protein
MKKFRPALETLEEIEVLFVPRLQLWFDLPLQISPAPLPEFKLLSEAENACVSVDKPTPETGGPIARECEMKVENLSGHLGQDAGDAADRGVFASAGEGGHRGLSLSVVPPYFRHSIGET